MLLCLFGSKAESNQIYVIGSRLLIIATDAIGAHRRAQYTDAIEQAVRAGIHHIVFTGINLI